MGACVICGNPVGYESYIGPTCSSLCAGKYMEKYIICENRSQPSPYSSLEKVFIDAKTQASDGKGKERHAEPGKSFEKQDICQEARDLGLAYPIGQARKKAKESMRLEPGHAYQELLGAINYLAAAAIVVREQFSAQK